jgi:hypothetical protein
MAQLYANENFPRPVVEELRRLGHQVLTSQESGMADRAIPDPEVLQFARSKGHALLTLNRRHFFKLHAADGDHSGIIACTYDPDFARQARAIDAAIGEAGNLKGKLLRVNRPSK